LEDDSPFHDEEHFVAALAVLKDGLAAREGGLAQARRYDAQALVVEALPRNHPLQFRYFPGEKVGIDINKAVPTRR
jgi:hypothetical protein